MRDAPTATTPDEQATAPTTAPATEAAGAEANPGTTPAPAPEQAPEVPAWAHGMDLSEMHLDPSMLRDSPMETLAAVSKSLREAQTHISQTRKDPTGKPLSLGAGADPETPADPNTPAEPASPGDPAKDADPTKPEDGPSTEAQAGYAAVEAFYSELPENASLPDIIEKAGLNEHELGAAWRESGKLKPEHYDTFKQKLGVHPAMVDSYYNVLADNARTYEDQRDEMAEQAAGGKDQLKTLLDFGGKIQGDRAADIQSRLNNKDTVVGAVMELTQAYNDTVGGSGDQIRVGSSAARGAAQPAKTMDEYRAVVRRYQSSLSTGAPDKEALAIMVATDSSTLM